MSGLMTSGHDEFRHAELGRKGRAETAGDIVIAVAAGSGKSFSACCGPALRQRAGDLLGRDDQTPERLLAGPAEATAERCRGRQRVLIASDTTAFNYSGRWSLVELGGIGDQVGAKGVWCHGALVLSEDGEPLGVVDAHFWSRGEKVSEEDDKRPYEEKESFKWQRSREATERVLGSVDSQRVELTDAESDVFEYYAAPRRPGTELLGRAAQDRAIEWQGQRGLLWEVTGRWEVAGTMAVKVPRKRGKQEATATLEVRFGELLMQPPARLAGAAPVQLWVVRATETEASRQARGVGPPARAGEVIKDEQQEVAGRAIDWILYSTLPVTSLEEAQERLRWYKFRWRIEELHKVLKSGLQAEQLQVRTVPALLNHLALYYVAAWRVLALRYLTQTAPERPAAWLFTADELQVLRLLTARRVDTVREAARALGALAGRDMYPSSPDPGAPSIWTGQRELAAAMRLHAAIRSAEGRCAN